MTAMNRYQRRRELAVTIEQCHKCPGMNEPGKTEAAPGFGSIRSPVVIVGQSLCEKCMDTKVPFTGGSGRLIDDSLKAANLDKPEIFITNVVHCHPPNNRKSYRYEIDNCKQLGLTPDGGHLTGGTAGPAGRMSVCRASVVSTPRSFGSRLPAW